MIEALNKLNWLKEQRMIGRFTCEDANEDTDMTILLNQVAILITSNVPVSGSLPQQGCCMSCSNWRYTQDGKGECKVFDKYTEEGFWCKAWNGNDH